jgi:2-keto-4-pentenoate hydratase/2-oxohepta-3-ene-1,7-dioic acid hydratase in catechol pathway
MKIATYWHEGTRQVGRLSADGGTVSAFLMDAPTGDCGALALVERMAAGLPLPESGPSLPLSAVRLDAPFPRPRRDIFCVGKNYHAHAREFAQSGFDSSATDPGSDIPSHPIIFSKLPESVIAPGAAIQIPGAVSVAIDYEAELAVVIGRGGRGITAAQAMEHVWGYTIVNDVTARDWQQRHKQWLMGKSFDTFCPMGPWLVSADEVDGADTRVRCWVNDELRQDARTSDLIFDIPTLIETISAGITLHPGDVIATGTPVGVGIGFKPPKYLQPGDRVRIEIDGIGVLENPVTPAAGIGE